MVEDTISLYLMGEINEATSKDFVCSLSKLRLDSEDRLNIYLSSDGGDLYLAMMLYDVICSLSQQVTVIGCGRVMSAATVVFAAGDERYCYEHTWFMVHDSRYTDPTECRHSTWKEYIDHVEKLERQWANIMEVRSRISSDEWLEMCQGDYYFEAIKARKLGLVTKII